MSREKKEKKKRKKIVVIVNINNNTMLYGWYKVQISPLWMVSRFPKGVCIFRFFLRKIKDDICYFIAKVTHNYKDG